MTNDGTMHGGAVEGALPVPSAGGSRLGTPITAVSVLLVAHAQRVYINTLTCTRTRTHKHKHNHTHVHACTHSMHRLLCWTPPAS